MIKLFSKSALFFAGTVLVASSTLAGEEPPLFAPLEKLAAGNPPVRINRQTVRGGGVIACRVLENEGTITLGGLPSIVKARVMNRGQLEIAYEQAVFTEDFFNTGTVKTTDTVVRFDGRYQEDGSYVSDPSANYFWDLFVGDNGTLVGGEGDMFYVRGDFISTSTRNEGWSTAECLLEFSDGFRDGSLDSAHDFSLTGSDLGPISAGYSANFAWGILSIAGGNTLRLLDGNIDTGGALYVGAINGLDLSGTTVANISSPDGINIYYRPELPANSYLDGEIFYFADYGGRLIPIWPKSPDIDHDGDVDGADAALLAAAMNSSCALMSACPCDLDDDRQVTETDLQLFAPYFATVVE